MNEDRDDCNIVCRLEEAIYSSTLFDRTEVRASARLRVSGANFKIATWNVEGLTDEKLLTIQRAMKELDIGIICIQETRKKLSDYFITEDHFLVILSGRADDQREYAGVGFIVAPWL